MYIFQSKKKLKWDSKATKGIHVRYEEEIKRYRIWYPSQNKVDTQRDVIFEEQSEKGKSKKEKENKEEIAWTDVYGETSEKSEKSKNEENRRNRR